MTSLLTFDPKRYFLGTLCERGHDWNHSQKTLRHLKGRACCECKKAQDRAAYWPPEWLKERDRRYQSLLSKTLAEYEQELNLASPLDTAFIPLVGDLGHGLCLTIDAVDYSFLKSYA